MMLCVPLDSVLVVNVACSEVRIPPLVTGTVWSSTPPLQLDALAPSLNSIVCCGLALLK
jgi:hypothetical protein